MLWLGARVCLKLCSLFQQILISFNQNRSFHLPCKWSADFNSFRALHEKEKRSRGGFTRNQFFLIALTCSFAYYVFPGYLFSMLTSVSWVCWFAPKSVLVQQLGSGLQGLGIGALGFDWSTVAAYLGSPLASPWFATANVAFGFCIIMYVIVPICYWLNIYQAKTFPLYSNYLFQGNGEEYDIRSIVDSKFRLDRKTYASIGPVHLSTFFAMTYGFGFATLPATIMHVFLFNGRYAPNLPKLESMQPFCRRRRT